MMKKKKQSIKVTPKINPAIKLLGDSNRTPAKRMGINSNKVTATKLNKRMVSDAERSEFSVTRDMLTEEQVSALSNMESFIISNNRQMLLGGYAGTGKTTIIKMILEYCSERDVDVVCTAPTNEAVRVIARSTGRADFTVTIYSLLGLRLFQDDDKPAVLAEAGESKLHEFELLIIDEASMINSDLFDKIQLQLKLHSHVKVIYVGDPAQLPPVKDPQNATISPVFRLDKKTWSILRQVQRCTENNPIIQLVTLIRDNIKSDRDVFEHTNQYNAESDIGIKFITPINGMVETPFGPRYALDDSEFMGEMFADFDAPEYKVDANHVRALAYTNAKVNEYNDAIRKHLYGDDVDSFIAGEILLVDEPIIERNKRGEELMAYTVGERIYVHSVSLLEDDDYGIKYWCMDVENRDAPKLRRVRMTIRVVHDDDYELKLKTQSRLATLAKEKTTHMTKGAAWGAYFTFKNRFASVKYIYATTVHKAQGSTFKNVYVDNRDMNILRWSHIERNKLKYVAFTRASHKLVISD